MKRKTIRWSRRSAPLVIGYGKKDVFVGSDAVSLSNLIESVIFLDEDDVAIVSKKETNIYDKFGERVNKDAFFKTIGRLDGAFALCFMFKDDEEN